MLVTDIQMYSGHSSIPHGNYMLELMAKNTGAFEPVFSNDLELLKYPKIKEFDAIWLNNVCGMVYNDPEVREGILRFVREGGGMGGHHAVTFANNNWPEFAEMMGGWAGAHHTEKQVIKIDDPISPLTKMFGRRAFEHTDEFYQFPTYCALFAREAARAAEHRRGAFRPRHGQPLLSRVHAPRPGLRPGLDQDLRQGPHLLHAAGPHDAVLYRSAVDQPCPRRDPVHPRRSRRGRHSERQAREEAHVWKMIVRRPILLLGIALALAAQAQRKQPYTDWSEYGGSPDDVQYSALKQINKSNVGRLELAWSYPVPGTSGRFGFNPVVVDGDDVRPWAEQRDRRARRRHRQTDLDAIRSKAAPPTAASTTGRARTAPTAG